jgi:hypothetical protein
MFKTTSVLNKNRKTGGEKCEANDQQLSMKKQSAVQRRWDFAG